MQKSRAVGGVPGVVSLHFVFMFFEMRCDGMLLVEDFARHGVECTNVNFLDSLPCVHSSCLSQCEVVH